MKKVLFLISLKNLKKCYNNNFHFVAISEWLQKEAQRSLVLKK